MSPHNPRASRTEVSPGVWYADEPLVIVSAGDLATLSSKAASSPLGRVRLCVHHDVDARLHEMFIILSRETYIRPHRHVGKAESLLVLSGEADAVFFDDEGAITRVVRLGEYRSAHPFFYRIDQSVYHTLVVRTDVFVFKEATSGPLRSSESELAVWAPPESNAPAARAYALNLASILEARLSNQR